MPQMRTYEVTTNDNGVIGSIVVRVHSPADFLQHATMSAGEKAKPGKAYNLPNGVTLTYKTITKAQYDARVEAERAAGEANAATGLALSYQDYELGMGLPITPVSLDSEPEQPASDFTDGLTYSRDEMDAEPGEESPLDAVMREKLAAHEEAERVVDGCERAMRRLETERVISLRLSVNDDSHLTGETVFDDDVIESLGFDYFLNGVDYDAFVKVANAADYAVSTPCESMTRFLMAQPVTITNVTITTTADKLIDALTPQECAACAGAKFVGVADGKCDAHADNAKPERKGVIYFCPWNGDLPYEAEDTNNDRAVYFQTKPEAERYLREVWKIKNISYGGERSGEFEPEPDCQACLEAPRSVAAFKTPDAPRKLSKRQLRRQAGTLFGVRR